MTLENHKIRKWMLILYDWWWHKRCNDFYLYHQLSLGRFVVFWQVFATTPSSYPYFVSALESLEHDIWSHFFFRWHPIKASMKPASWYVSNHQSYWIMRPWLCSTFPSSPTTPSRPRYHNNITYRCTPSLLRPCNSSNNRPQWQWPRRWQVAVTAARDMSVRSAHWCSNTKRCIGVTWMCMQKSSSVQPVANVSRAITTWWGITSELAAVNWSWDSSGRTTMSSVQCVTSRRLQKSTWEATWSSTLTRTSAKYTD